MLDSATIEALARELHESERTREPLRQFSRRFPGMTIADGYAAQRAWVALKLAEGRVRRGHKIAVLNHPAHGIAWLADKLADHGEGLAASDVFHADYGPLGSISVRFLP
jgi:2-oxo-hept-3-ene-1,7-dioate hydratase